jgi:hypothetical protein
MEILISENTHSIVKNEFRISDRGEHEVRGFGKQNIYRLEGDFTAANDSTFL